ncbi:MAG: ZIP family metal transporter [Planctomycetes bacterium]|nr:ZIP family metal transporter [Planctomycetota bacterium]
MATFDWLVFVNAIGCTVGGVLPTVMAKRGEPGAAVHGFAAGTLLGTGLIVLMPEAATQLGNGVGYAVLGGFLMLYLFDRALLAGEESHGHEHTEVGHSHHMGALALAGFGVHSISDGAALGLTSTHPELGFPVVAGILFHEVPARFVLARLLVASGANRWFIVSAIVGLALIMVAAAYAVSAITSGVLFRAIPWGMGISAGMFLFISTSELLPRVHRAGPGRKSAVAAFFFGILCAVIAREIGKETA